VAVAVLLVACAAAPSAYAAETDLERYRPLLRLDGAETHVPVAVEGNRPVLYGRVAREQDGTRWLQYWLFYVYNEQDRGILHTGRHEGDWELVQIRLGDSGRPVRATLRQHTWAQSCAWDEVARDASGAPVVFVAHGSHANYSRAGDHDRPWPDPNDESDGRGRVLRPEVERISRTSPAWMSSPGRFGDSRASFVPGEQSSPRGPAFQPEWSHPAAFERSARACTASPPGRPGQLAAEVGLVGLVAVALLARRRRARAKIIRAEDASA
jgi:hypothetical protein